MKDTRVADAFAACLEAMEQTGASLEECLARYPDLRADLEPALRTVLQIRAVPEWHVSPDFKAAARQRIVRRIRQGQARPSLGERLQVLNPLTWLGRLAQAPVAVRVVAMVLVALLLVTGGSAIASNDALPGNPLHQFKMATETLELMLRPAGEARTGLLIEILDRRASELLTMSWQEKANAAQHALVNYQAALQVGHKMLESYNAQDADAAAFAVQWQEALARNLAVMQGLVQAMPPSMQAGLKTAIANTEKEHAWVTEVLRQTPPAPEGPSPTKLPEGMTTPSRCTYTVKKGDSLSSIALRYKTTWQRLAALNNLTAPYTIQPGQDLVVPCSTGAGESSPTAPAEFKLCRHTVQRGDTLSSIAQRYNTTTRMLMALNNLPSADRINAGISIYVPCYAK